MASASDDVVDIPEGLDICHSAEDLQTFLNLVNLNFEIITKIAEDVQSISVKLPGVPSVVIPGWQGFTLPSGSDTPSIIPLKQPWLESAWTGATFPWNEPGTDQWRQGRVGGLPGFTVPGVPDFIIPGIDPLTMTMQVVNTNFELLIKQIPSITQVPLLTPSVLANPCGYPGGSQQAIKDINEAMRKAQQGAGNGGGGCPSLAAYEDYTNSANWVDPNGGPINTGNPSTTGSVFLTSTTFTFNGFAISDNASSTNGNTRDHMELTIPAAALGVCSHITISATLFAQMDTLAFPVDGGDVSLSISGPWGSDGVSLSSIGNTSTTMSRTFGASGNTIISVDASVTAGIGAVLDPDNSCSGFSQITLLTITLAP